MRMDESPRERDYFEGYSDRALSRVGQRDVHLQNFKAVFALHVDLHRVVGHGHVATHDGEQFLAQLGQIDRPVATTVTLVRNHQFQSLLDRKSTRLNPVTNAHLVCRLLLEKKKNKINNSICRYDNNKVTHIVTRNTKDENLMII